MTSHRRFRGVETKFAMKPAIEGKELTVSGKTFRTARLRHEWCDFLSSPPSALNELKASRARADLFTFVGDIGVTDDAVPYHREDVDVAVLPITTFQQWWDDIGFKPRNKIRKAQKSGVETRIVELTDEFAQGIEAIYNESPVRQGRKFSHYGKTAQEIKEELGSFADRCTLVGAYFNGELIGFMKLFAARHALRTVHIIAKLSHREKCAMDILIAKAVEICEQKQLRYLHYGSWTDGGVGAFRTKHGFQPLKVPRYFVPLTWRGELMLKLKLHRPMRERLPKTFVDSLIRLRTKWNSVRFADEKKLVETGAS